MDLFPGMFVCYMQCTQTLLMLYVFFQQEVRTHLRTFYNLIQNLRALQERLSHTVSAEVNARKNAVLEIKVKKKYRTLKPHNCLYINEKGSISILRNCINVGDFLPPYHHNYLFMRFEILCRHSTAL